MLDSNGFRKKTYADLMDEMEVKAKELFGEKINLSPRSFLGILIRLYAWFLAIIWQVVEKVYNNSFVGTAEGVSLDRAVKFKSMDRNVEDYAQGKVKIRGKPNETIASGLIVGTKQDIYFETIEDAMLGGIGEAIVQIYAEEPGTKGNVNAGEITELLYPDPETIYEVINLEPTVGGSDREGDLALRERYHNSPSNRGSSSLLDIQAALLEVSGVTMAIVSENTSHLEVDGLPPNCIAPFVFGGTDEDVAHAIISRKAGGIRSHGTTIVEVIDSQSAIHPIGFSRPVIIQVYVKLTLIKGENFIDDNDSLIRSRILSYIGGEDETGVKLEGLNIGENVSYAKIASSIFSVDGVDDATVELSTNGTNYTQANIAISANQIARTSADKVVIV